MSCKKAYFFEYKKVRVWSNFFTGKTYNIDGGGFSHYYYSFGILSWYNDDDHDDEHDHDGNGRGRFILHTA